jgi:hypothetical protein
MVVRLRLNKICRSSRHLANGAPHDQFEPRVRIDGGIGSRVNDDDALGAASVIKIPPSLEQNYTSVSDTPSSIPNIVRYDEDGDTPALSTNRKGHTHTTNESPQIPRFDTDNDHHHIHTHTPLSATSQHSSTFLRLPLRLPIVPREQAFKMNRFKILHSPIDLVHIL